MALLYLRIGNSSPTAYTFSVHPWYVDGKKLSCKELESKLALLSSSSVKVEIFVNFMQANDKNIAKMMQATILTVLECSKIRCMSALCVVMIGIISKHSVTLSML